MWEAAKIPGGEGGTPAAAPGGRRILHRPAATDMRPAAPDPARPAAEAGREAGDVMRFERVRPRSLPGLVACIWEQRATRPARWRILPSGWVELIFRLGERIAVRGARQIGPDTDAIRGVCFLSGLHTRPLDLAVEGFHTFGVQLHPAAVPALFGLPCAEVRDAAVAGDRVLADLGRVEDRLRAAPDFAARARWMEAELARRLVAADRLDDALEMWRLSQALPTVDTSARELDRRLGYSRSHAHRLFGEWFGQPAGDAIRMRRFVRAVRALHGDGGTLTEVGHRVGYFDQSHFIRDFRTFAGMTPGAYRRRRGATPGQLPG